MAKASFHTGWSGSPKHTSTVGDGSQLGAKSAGYGPRIGPGCEGRNVRPEINSSGGKNGQPAVKSMKRYSEE